MVLSTSGTATANHFPAIIEASLSRIPIYIFSADRPENLVGTGENQTINQQYLYGEYPRYFKDIGLPTDNFDSLEKILQQAMNHSMGADLKHPPGPVHLNCPFNEPLMPDELQKIEHPEFSFEPSKSIETDFTNIAILPKSSKPLIVMGPMEENHYQKEILRFAEKLQAPIFADALSQLRYGYEHQNILAHYDHFLKIIDIEPDLIIRFGRKPSSKILCKLLDMWKPQTYLVDRWQQYNDDCPNFIQAPIDKFCQIQINEIECKGESNWLNLLLSFEKTIESFMLSETEYSEASIVRVCQESLSDDDQLIIGNSMPIRDIDMFTSVTKIQLDTYANRGASGIDGVISTALGISATNNNRRSLLIIGDLSLYHDMNGLLASQHGINLTIVVINNNGGGIFSFLPIADAGIKTFKKYWTTDTGLDLKKVSELYQCQYYKTDNLEELRVTIKESFKKKGVQIIEIKTNIEDNVQAHSNFIKKIQMAIIPS